jgi:hypothetical protein
MNNGIAQSISQSDDEDGLAKEKSSRTVTNQGHGWSSIRWIEDIDGANGLLWERKYHVDQYG